MPRSICKDLSKPGLLLVLLLLPASCREDAPPAPATPKPSAPAPAPVDHLAPGELKEGKVDAFGLKLPEGLAEELRTPNRVEAEGRIPAEKVANYIRKRTKAASVELGAARTVFESAKVLSSNPSPTLRIEVVPRRSRTRVIVRDLSPPPVDPLLSPEERWKKYGFDKDGKLLDPDKMM